MAILRETEFEFEFAKSTAWLSCKQKRRDPVCAQSGIIRGNPLAQYANAMRSTLALALSLPSFLSISLSCFSFASSSLLSPSVHIPTYLRAFRASFGSFLSAGCISSAVQSSREETLLCCSAKSIVDNEREKEGCVSRGHAGCLALNHVARENRLSYKS